MDINNMFLGFEGQRLAKPFDVGRFRDVGESYHIYDTQRDVAHKTDYYVGTRRIVLVPKKEEVVTGHTDLMNEHLISEFQCDETDDKPVLYAVLSALGEEMDEITQVFKDLNEKRNISNSVGKQLDGIGEIVAMDRTIDKAMALSFFGFSDQPNTGTFDMARFRNPGESYLESYNLQDAEYRTVLRQKIRKNNSDATTEEMIRSLKFIFDAEYVVLEEPGNANVVIGIGRKLTANDMLLAESVDLMVRAAGVGLKYKVDFDVNNYFGFLGQPYARGFDDGKFVDMF